MDSLLRLLDSLCLIFFFFIDFPIRRIINNDVTHMYTVLPERDIGICVYVQSLTPAKKKQFSAYYVDSSKPHS